jgi:hypothetical protein
MANDLALKANGTLQIIRGLDRWRNDLLLPPIGVVMLDRNESNTISLCGSSSRRHRQLHIQEVAAVYTLVCSTPMSN